MNVVTLFFFFFNFNFITCPYTPGGDDVQPGSVLLPATRRGRYLANIVRRQAVDGTGIKFNKDADRINAESKKKVDVLSEELLPYIIAEQERRTTLYKRIMTAIQNGEKGVTIAEIRNKPPLLIRKGLLYRCPSNRAPKEPDGSGTLMCEDDTEPTQIMYDSCLSAEDKELYVAESKYFFCNRHRVEGPDLPRNGTTVIGCPPVERTSLNYTSGKCALEDSDDVVVHYRYYPDRTYKFVTELDPDREVCEHWNPCQVGYIYSLPSPDQALLANELWKDYTEKFDGDEIVPPIPEDSWEEYVPVSSINYTSSPRRINIPPDYEFVGIMKYNPISGRKTPLSKEEFTSKMDPSGNFTMVTVDISEWSSENEGEYLAHLKPKPTRRNSSLKVLFTKFLMLVRSSISLPCMTVDLLQGQQTNFMNIPYRCNRCRLINVMIRSIDGNFYNMDNSKYHTKETIDRYGKPQQSLEIKFEGMKPQDFGNYFCIIQNSDGIEERIKAVTVVFIKLVPIRESVQVGVHFDRTMKYSCDDCTLKDILCNGESVLSAGRISIISVSHMISLNFPRFESANACVYMGFFKELGKVFMKVLAVIDGVDLPKKGLKIPPPPQGEQFEEVVPYSCSDCTVEKVFVNGIKLGTDMISNGGPVAFYITTPTEIIIRITEFVSTYEGVYQAVFQIGGELVTKTILEIGDETGEPATTESPESTTPEDTDISTEHEGGSTTEGDSTTASASGSTEPSASSEEAPTTTETPPA